MIRLAIIGAAGRMGHALIRCAGKTDDLRVTAALEQPGHPDLGRDAGDVTGGPALGIPLTADRAALQKADVVIDFTLHNAVPTNVRAAAELGKPAIIGTTGLLEVEAAVVRKAATAIPIVWAPNMSLGVNLLFALVERAAGILGFQYRAEVDETHHVHKKDAPSGTALRLAENVAKGRGQNLDEIMIHVPGEGPAPEYPEDKLLVRSHRRGEVVGDHTVSFSNAAERVEITHHAWTRDALAMGALHAARWVVGKPPRLYDMQDVLGLSAIE